MDHDQRMSALLGGKPDLTEEEFNSSCIPAVLYLVAVLSVGLVVQFCSPPRQEVNWHQQYVQDHCDRCDLMGEPCCIYIGPK